MSVDPRRVAAAHAVLAQLGVSVEDLQTAPAVVPVMPTVAQYLPRVQAAASPSSRRTCGTYWARMVGVWGDWPLATIAATDVEALQRTARRARFGGPMAGVADSGGERDQCGAGVLHPAIADGLIAAGASPAHQVSKPRRLPSHRRALTAGELAEINAVARTSGNDVVLDALLLRLHTETACRRGGDLGLRLIDLDVPQGLVRLREKGETLRWQPITVDLAMRLSEHAAARGAVLPDDQLLRFRDGRGLTSRHYDQLWRRIGERLPWVAAHNVSTHWLRHTTLTWVERNFSYGIARAYAGHTDNTGPATTAHIKADL